jgi:hypothetical protein
MGGTMVIDRWFMLHKETGKATGHWVHPDHVLEAYMQLVYVLRRQYIAVRVVQEPDSYDPNGLWMYTFNFRERNDGTAIMVPLNGAGPPTE